jgi:hypothetical protein
MCPIAKELRYLPKTEVDTLELHSLGYFEDVLLVRKEYLTAMNILNTKSWKECGGHGVVIIGQPGIGEKFSQITVMLLTTAFQVGNDVVVLFGKNGVQSAR